MPPMSAVRCSKFRNFILLCAIMALPFQARADSPPSSPRVREAIARHKHRLTELLAKKHIRWGAPIYLRIFKSERRLEIWMLKGRGYRLFQSFPICTFGRKGLGPKTRQGDGFAPEGFYRVGPGQMNPFSRFHLSFNLGYPNAYDRRCGRTGGALMVHGNCVSIGCYAMTDAAMEEIYLLAHAALLHGQPGFAVHIFPFEMTSANMKKHRHSSWIDFWDNLKQGYDRFPLDGHVPPEVSIKNGRYHFEPGLARRVRHPTDRSRFQSSPQAPGHAAIGGSP